MNKLNFLFILSLLNLILCTSLIAQPKLVKQRCIGYTNDEEFRDVLLNKDGTFWLTMYADSMVPEFANRPFLGAAALIKMDTALNILDVKYFGGSNGSTGIFRLAKDEINNQIYCIGVTNATNGDGVGGSGNGDIFIVKTDSNGNKIWVKTFPTNGNSGIKSFEPICGKYSIAGIYSSSFGGIITNHYGSSMQQDVAMMAIDTTGNIKWIKFMGGSANDGLSSENLLQMQNCKCRADISTYSIDYDLASTYGTTDTLKNWMFIIDSTGYIYKQNIEREFLYSSNLSYRNHNVLYKNKQTLSIGAARANSYYNPTYPNHDKSEGKIAIYDSSLNLIKMKLFGGKGDDAFFNYCTDALGNYYFGGITTSVDGDLLNSQVYGNFWIMKTDSNFNFIWSRKFGDNTKYFGNPPINLFVVGHKLYFWACAFIPASGPNGDVIGGTYCGNPLSALSSDAWVAVFDLNTTVGLQIEPNTQNINNFTVYPNPTSQILSIKTDKPEEAINIKIVLADISGRVMYKEKFHHFTEQSIDVSLYETGTYILNIESKGKSIFTNKIIINH